MKIYHGTFSECGPRKNNDDHVAYKYMPEQNRAVFVLCDGMGGHECGEVASRFVAEHICGYWEKNPKRPDSEKKIIDACQETKIAYDNQSRVEMGTTMAMDRLVEMNCYSREKETYQYGVSRCTDGNGAKWIKNEQQ